jgi:Zn-dependent protease with chaperone function
VTTVSGRFFDGHDALGTWAYLALEHGDTVRLEQADGGARQVPLGALRVSERFDHAPRVVTFPDGAYLEIEDLAGMDALLAASGWQDGRVVKLQRRWPLALAALALLLAVTLAAWFEGIPRLAEVVATHMPPDVERRVGEETEALLDELWFGETHLAGEDRARLLALLDALLPPEVPRPRVEFRHGGDLGANALALPHGVIVVTDQLVESLGEDELVLAVLAHEMGHLANRHFLRGVTASALLGALVSTITGDSGMLLTAIPVVLGSLHYSRSMELEADWHAAALLEARGRPAEDLATALERLADSRERRRGGRAYLQTHPSVEDRAAYLRSGAWRKQGPQPFAPR